MLIKKIEIKDVELVKKCDELFIRLDSIFRQHGFEI